MSKHNWDITQQDLFEHPVWYFPMSDCVDIDETIVVPATIEQTLDPNSQIIVRALFKDSYGGEYTGYIYYGLDELEYSQPCLYKDCEAVNFWFGITVPAKEDLPKLAFPLIARSFPIKGLDTKTIKIEGYGYIDENSDKQMLYC